MTQRSVKEQMQSYIDWWQDSILEIEKNEPELKIASSCYKGRVFGMKLAAQILGIDVTIDFELLRN